MEAEAERHQADWVVIRHAYETNDGTIAAICARFGVTKSQLERRYRKERWVSRQAKLVDRRGSTRERLFSVLERQVSKLANEAGTTLGEKEAQQLTELIKNFDKLASMEAAATTGGPAQKKDMADLRDKLAKRIDQFKRR